MSNELLSYRGRIPSLPWEVKWSKQEAIVGLLVVYGIAMALVLLPTGHPVLKVVTVPLIVVVMVLVPGMLTQLIRPRASSVNARFLIYAFGLSLIEIMAVGLVINIALPPLGIKRPLSVWSLVISMSTFVAVVASIAFRAGSGKTVHVQVPDLLQPAPLLFLLLPLWSILGVTLLNRTGNNLLLMGVLVVIAILPIVTVLYVDDRWFSLGIWTTALAILYHKSLWKFAQFSGNSVVDNAWELRRWTPGVTELQPASTALLELGVLFPSIARMTGVDIMTQMEVINPFLVSFIPVAMFVTFRRYTDSQKAFLGATLFTFAHPFYLQYPTAGRAATPVIFLALFGLVMSDDDNRQIFRSAIGLMFVAGIAVSHYGTSYYVMASFVGALVLLLAFPLLDGIVERLGIRRPIEADGSLKGLAGRFEHIEEETAFTWSLVLYFSAAAIAWYLYSVTGARFATLPRHVARNVNSLLQGRFVSGRTAARIQRDYGTLSIRLSKSIYLLLGLLMGLGLLYVYYKRFVTSDSTRFDDRYLAVASCLLGVFGLTILFRNWGGGRPMMITISFTAVFAVIGFVELIKNGWSIVQPRLERISGLERTFEDGLLAAFGVVLMVLFLLNSSVVAAVALQNEQAPSNVLLQEQMANSDSPGLIMNLFQATDIATHVWIIEHGGEDRFIYGDRIAGGQTDWYRPSIQYRTDGISSYGTSPVKQPRGRLAELYESGTGDGYIMLLGHNLALNVVLAGDSTERHDLQKIRSELRNRNRIYTTGHSMIYFTKNGTNEKNN